VAVVGEVSAIARTAACPSIQIGRSVTKQLLVLSLLAPIGQPGPTDPASDSEIASLPFRRVSGDFVVLVETDAGSEYPTTCGIDGPDDKSAAETTGWTSASASVSDSDWSCTLTDGCPEVKACAAGTMAYTISSDTSVTFTLACGAEGRKCASDPFGICNEDGACTGVSGYNSIVWEVDDNGKCYSLEAHARVLGSGTAGDCAFGADGEVGWSVEASLAAGTTSIAHSDGNAYIVNEWGTTLQESGLIQDACVDVNFTSPPVLLGVVEGGETFRLGFELGLVGLTNHATGGSCPAVGGGCNAEDFEVSIIIAVTEVTCS